MNLRCRGAPRVGTLGLLQDVQKLRSTEAEACLLALLVNREENVLHFVAPLEGIVLAVLHLVVDGQQLLDAMLSHVLCLLGGLLP